MNIPGLEEHFKNLPPVIQNAITESNWAEEIRRITKTNNLRIDQGAAIEKEVLLIMLGLEDSGNFKKNIVSEIGIEKDLAEDITEEVNQKIFKAIYSILIDADKESDNEDEDENENENEDEEVEGEDNEGMTGTKDDRDSVMEEIENPTEIASAHTKESKTGHIPENLPKGDVEDVPAHGHDHEKDEMVEDKLSQTTSSEHEVVDISLNKEEFEERKTKAGYGENDPYREAV